MKSPAVAVASTNIDIGIRSASSHTYPLHPISFVGHTRFQYYGLTRRNIRAGGNAVTRESETTLENIRRTMEQWSISPSFLAQQIGVTRQYVWQILHGHTRLSDARLAEVERVVSGIVRHQLHLTTMGDRLRAARKAAGLTLRQAGEKLGYTWASVQRWESNASLPTLEALVNLCSVYHVSFELVIPPKNAGGKGRIGIPPAYRVPNGRRNLHLAASPEGDPFPFDVSVIQISAADVERYKNRPVR